MIPAIASCLFVIYLYQHLQAEETGGSAPGEPAGLEGRMDSLRQRLEALGSTPGNGRDAS